MAEYQDIPLAQIKEPDLRIRLEISQEAITELADNIRSQGLLQPILLRQVDNGYEIVAGHRRFLAFRHLGRPSIPAKIVKMDDTEVALARASENISRTDLSPLEEGAIYIDLHERLGLSYDQIAQKMGKRPGVVKRRMDLIKMPPNLQKAIHEKKISVSAAEELWSISDPAVLDYYLQFAIDHGATQMVCRQWVKDWKDSKRRAKEGAEKGVSPSSPAEPRPVYIACDICTGPFELGKEVTIRACPDCAKRIQEALK